MNNKAIIKRNIIVCFLIGLLMLTLNTSVRASDVTANSCSATDIQSAIDTCISTGGGTVNIPACNADNTWTSDDKIRVSSSTPFRLIGAGADSTIIGYQDGAYPGYDGAMFFDGGGIEEIAHFTIRGSDTSKIGTGLKFYSMNTQNLNIHHLKIQKFSGSGINLCANPNSPFVIHHNEIGDQYGSGLYGIYIVGTNSQSDYVIPPSLGINNPNAVFIEDNIFDGAYHSISGFAVSKIVLRHNIVRNMTSFVDGHGPCYDVGCRRDANPDSGVYIYEIYDNTFIRGDWCVNIRGGTGIVTDNVFDGCHPGFRMEVEGCAPGSDCDVSKGCPHSSTDTTKCYQTPYMWWIWDNTLLNGAEEVGYGDRGTGCIRENYEYYLRAPQAGDPVGNYTKYEYPHPLVSDGSVDWPLGPPGPPTNLRRKK